MNSHMKELFLYYLLNIYKFSESSIFLFKSLNKPNSLFKVWTLPSFKLVNLKPQNKKPKKFYYIILSIVSSINIFLIIYYLYYLISEYINCNSININIDFYYLIILNIIFSISIFDLKKDTNKQNDILTIITCIIISLVHYRYFLDPHFLHNLVNLDSATVGNTSSHYIYQYYPYFIIMLSTLLIQRKINNIPNK